MYGAVGKPRNHPRPKMLKARIGEKAQGVALAMVEVEDMGETRDGLNGRSSG